MTYNEQPSLAHAACPTREYMPRLRRIPPVAYHPKRQGVSSGSAIGLVGSVKRVIIVPGRAVIAGDGSSPGTEVAR
jgi:hypothetical protein